MKIALVFPPLYGVDMPPIGIAYIAARLLNDGHQVKIFCLNSELYQTTENKKILWSWEAAKEWSSIENINKHFKVSALLKKWSSDILSFNPEIIGFSINTYSQILSQALTHEIRQQKRDSFIVFGGPWCTEFSPNPTLNPDVNLYIRGEGEAIISQIASSLQEKKPLENLNGTIINRGEKFQDNGWSESPLNINTLPFPALSLFEFERYTNRKEIPIIFSRGCDYACKFCTDKPMWGNYRMRKTDDIIAEMETHSKIFKRNNFKCNDLMLNGDLNGLAELSSRLIEKKSILKWGGMARARKDMSPKLLNQLKLSGCSYLTYGIESGAKKILTHMGKPEKKETAQTLKHTSLAKIPVNTLWMVGYPTETWSDFLETLVFLLKNRKYIDNFVSVSACYIPAKSWLKQNQKILNIAYRQDSQWYIHKTNTPFIRNLRRKILLYFAKLIKLYKGGIT